MRSGTTLVRRWTVYRVCRRHRDVRYVRIPQRRCRKVCNRLQARRGTGGRVFAINGRIAGLDLFGFPRDLAKAHGQARAQLRA